MLKMSYWVGAIFEANLQREPIVDNPTGGPHSARADLAKLLKRLSSLDSRD